MHEGQESKPERAAELHELTRMKELREEIERLRAENVELQRRGAALAHQAGPLLNEVADRSKEIARLRSMKPDARTFPVQAEKGAKPHPMRIPWSIAELAYSVYAGMYGKSQSLERLGQRGGFGPCEMDEFVPDWRERCCEFEKLRAENAELRKETQDREGWRAISLEQFKRIGAALDPIRQKRHTGEPARSDAEEIESLVNENAELCKACEAVYALIADSRGVAGLHLNGDEATWDSLQSGGYYEEWLMALDAVRPIVDNAKKRQAAESDRSDAP